MKTKTKKSALSAARIQRMRVQGYTDQSDIELQDMAFGNRFAYRLCTVLLILGVGFASVPLLGLMMAIAALGVILPFHPFDYIYNHAISEKMGKPHIPPRSPQLKFACTTATLWIGTTLYMFYSGNMIAGYILGGMLISVAALVSTTDICIPSIIYNACTRKSDETFF